MWKMQSSKRVAYQLCKYDIALRKNVENNDLMDSEICTHSIYGLFDKTCQLITLKCAQCLLLSTILPKLSC